MKKYICLFLLLSLIGFATKLPAQTQLIEDPNTPDTLWVDSATAFVSGVGIVPVSFFNDEELTLVEATLEHYSDQIKVDSFSFAGGRLDSDDYNNNILIDTDSTRITIFSFTTSTIPTGRGLLGNLYYSYSQTIIPQVVTIDTTSWFIGPILHTTTFRTAEDAMSFVPQFVRGYLDILEEPATFDSVWIDDVEAAPGDPIAVNVYAYNERNLAKIALALDYGSELLAFDSVSFAGTRSEPAPTKTVQPQTSLHKLYIVVEFGESTPLPSDTGPVATLHFTVDPTAPEEIIVIDSTTVGIISNTRYTLTTADGSISFVPLFTSGSVAIKTSTDVEDITDQKNLPTEYALTQNYPNPFNPSTNIEFSLPQLSHVKLEVYNILGRCVRRLIDRDLPAGEHRLVFDSRSDSGNSLATGVYFYRLTTESFEQTKKMLLVK
ncbi:MAG: T9SS type A sorting domain-containing protein [candidate division Zixibacteria bacterium]|nr:T9SS type A sorting domain-containing protein [candidate division Zixibacteria bacterium]